jgi:hypothetical protein
MLVTPTDVVDRPEQKCESDAENSGGGKKQRKRRNRRNRGQRQRTEAQEPLQQAGDSEDGDGDDGGDGGSRARPLNVATDSSTTAE